MPIELSREEVHLWRAALDVPAERLRTLQETLSPDERGRAARFRFPLDRQRFTAARGALRWVLSRYLNSEPQRLRFSYGRYGKPFLDGHPELQFNLSHCRELAVYAVCLGRQVGVDLECLSRRLDFEGIARRFFTPQEQRLLAASPAGERASVFFRCWTRREAYLKAHGEGLGALVSCPGYELTLRVGRPILAASRPSGRLKPAGKRACRLESPPHIEWHGLSTIERDRTLATATVESAAGWTVIELSPEPDFLAAVAVEGESCRLRLFQYLSQCNTSESGRLDFSGASAG